MALKYKLIKIIKNHKKILILLITISVLIFITGYIIVYPENIGLCSYDDRVCITSYPVYNTGEPLLLGSILPFFMFLILLFCSKEIFDIWKKFAIIFLPLSIILIAIAPVTSYDMMFDLNKETVTWLMSALFFIFSLLIIIINIIKRK